MKDECDARVCAWCDEEIKPGERKTVRVPDVPARHLECFLAVTLCNLRGDASEEPTGTKRERAHVALVRWRENHGLPPLETAELADETGKR